MSGSEGKKAGMKKVWKLFWLWDFDKEEKWLNEMSAQGWQLRHVGFCNYLFEAGEPGAYAYRLEMLDAWPRSDAGRDYIAFVESTGAEYIGSLLRWTYFRKTAALGPFDIFSDLDSRIKHLNRILILSAVIAMMVLINGSNLLVQILRYNYTLSRALLAFYAVFALLLAYGIIRLALVRRRLAKTKLYRE